MPARSFCTPSQMGSVAASTLLTAAWRGISLCTGLASLIPGAMAGQLVVGSRPSNVPCVLPALRRRPMPRLGWRRRANECENSALRSNSVPVEAGGHRFGDELRFRQRNARAKPLALAIGRGNAPVGVRLDAQLRMISHRFDQALKIAVVVCANRSVGI